MAIPYIIIIICSIIQGWILKSIYDDWKFEKEHRKMVKKFCEDALISCDKMTKCCDRIQNVAKDGKVWIDTE